MEKKDKQPLQHSIGIELSKFFPNISKNISKNITKQCERWNHQKNATNDIMTFIRDYDINWRESKRCNDSKNVLECARKYKTMNEFFGRKLYKLPLIEHQNRSDVLISPADCRIIAFKSIKDSTKFWIKGKEFNLKSFLKNSKLSEYFLYSSLIICRLSPQDYHRFHFPVDCVYMGGYKIKGKYYSVSNKMIQSSVNVLGENKRQVHLLYNKFFGNIAMVIVGATCVGSIIISSDVKEGKYYRKGDYFGKFAFGGSTIVLLVNHIGLKNQLLKYSKMSKELYTRIGKSVGKINVK